MEVKEKAKQLIDLFSYSCRECDSFFKAYKSAVSHVEEILNFLEDDRKGFNWVKYYKKVLKELKKYDI